MKIIGRYKIHTYIYKPYIDIDGEIQKTLIFNGTKIINEKIEILRNYNNLSLVCDNQEIFKINFGEYTSRRESDSIILNQAINFLPKEIDREARKAWLQRQEDDKSGLFRHTDWEPDFRLEKYDEEVKEVFNLYFIYLKQKILNEGESSIVFEPNTWLDLIIQYSKNKESSNFIKKRMIMDKILKLEKINQDFLEENSLKNFNNKKTG